MSCFVPSGGDRLGEASSVSVSREREPETEPERHPGPPAAAVHHPLTVQRHADEGEPRGKGRERHRRDTPGANTWDLSVQENENLRGRIHQLEMSLQQRSEQLSHLERQSEQSEWRRGEELRTREDRVRELQLELDREKGKEPVVKVRVQSADPAEVKSHAASLIIRMLPLAQYVTQTVEVESPATLKHLSKARQRGELLSEKLAKQNERCKQLEEQIRTSDEHSCNLQHKVTAEGSPSQTSIVAALSRKYTKPLRITLI